MAATQFERHELEEMTSIEFEQHWASAESRAHAA
jgi:hypothetical protein